MTFDDDEQPTVERIPVGADGRVTFTFEAVAGGRRPMLIIAATAPDTLEAATYSLLITNR